MMDRKFRLPRVWSNHELRKLAPLFSGHVANVSGWDDRDKQGGSYRNYFSSATSYSITNYLGERGFQNQSDEIHLDLTGDLPPELVKAFDHVFNHTTLEHIFEVRKAFSNLCSMARECVIVVVPFAQVEHEIEGSFGDYWRFTPSCLRAMFRENGFEVIYEAESPDLDAGIYIFMVGSRNPDVWRGRMPSHMPIRTAGVWLGFCDRRIISRAADFVSRRLREGRLKGLRKRARQ